MPKISRYDDGSIHIDELQKMMKGQNLHAGWVPRQKKTALEMSEVDPSNQAKNRILSPDVARSVQMESLTRKGRVKCLLKMRLKLAFREICEEKDIPIPRGCELTPLEMPSGLQGTHNGTT